MNILSVHLKTLLKGAHYQRKTNSNIIVYKLTSLFAFGCGITIFGQQERE
jgi:hypothetical protein